MGKYVLKCLKCGEVYKKFRLICENQCDSLLRSVYKKKEFVPASETGIFKYMDWLPCEKKVISTIGPVVYKSGVFAKKIGLKNLYIAFNGYWPERGALNMTGTFKDYEALPTILNFIDTGRKRIILSSAGNTARAFAYAATLLDFETYIVLPDRMLNRMWLPTRPNNNVHIIAIKDSCDYYKAITISEKISREYNISSEAGARNIARRDGLGTVMLEAARTIGKFPDYYFQSVGSGSGAIATYEASLRLLDDKKFAGEKIPRLNLVQNAPFAPIYEAWKNGTHIRPEKNVRKQLKKINKMVSIVLANRKPPYRVVGGVLDILKQTNGNVHKVSNKEAMEASRKFQEQEGIDIDPAASVCVAALIKSVKKGCVGKNEIILLNITGGGSNKLKKDYQCSKLNPRIVIHDETDLNLKAFIDKKG